MVVTSSRRRTRSRRDLKAPRRRRRVRDEVPRHLQQRGCAVAGAVCARVRQAGQGAVRAAHAQHAASGAGRGGERRARAPRRPAQG